MSKRTRGEPLNDDVKVRAVSIGADPSVHDSRTVHLTVDGAPDVRTRAGKLPIRPTSVSLTYSIPDGRLWSVTIVGDPTDHRERERRTRWTTTIHGDVRPHISHVTRRPDVGSLPPWLMEIADQFRPTYTVTAPDMAGGAL